MFTEAVEFFRKLFSHLRIRRVVMDALELLWIFDEIKELPFVGSRKVENFVSLGSDSKVLRDVVLSFFVVRIVERFTPVRRSAFENGCN